VLCILFVAEAPGRQGAAPGRIRFVPETMYPAGSRARQVNPGFMLELGPDTLISDLPYIGRAFATPYGSTAGPLNVTLTGFRYTETKDRKGARIINVKPQAGGDIRELTLTCYKNGGAYLQVYFNRRQSIGFRGRIDGR